MSTKTPVARDNLTNTEGSTRSEIHKEGEVIGQHIQMGQGINTRENSKGRM